MALSTMYKGKNGSPKTTLKTSITASATSMTLEDASVLPAAPNICVIGDGENAEIVSYTSISKNTVSGLVRGLNGTTASAWGTDALVARNFTTLDHDTLINNITALNNDKQNKLSFDTTPTANSTKPVTSGGIYSALALKANAADLGSLAAKDKVDLTSDVSGILPVANGGTGNATGLAASATKLATARTVRTNLESTATASFNGTANIAPGVTGVLPVANGGTGNEKGLAASASKLAAAVTITTDLTSAEGASFDGSANVKPGVSGILPIANGGTGNATGLAASATKLANARTVRTNLASTSTASFNGTANIAPGVTGVLPVANGGTGNETGLAASATKLATARTITANLESAEAATFDGSANVTPGVSGILPIANGGTGNATGLAASAAKLANARTVRTNLASTSTASFDGSANIAPGVTGILPVANGGTGNKTGLAASASKLAAAVTITTDLASAESASFDGSTNVTPGVSGILPIANGGTGNATGLAAFATKLATARTVRTNLASTSTASFNGTANIAPGVTGVLPVANGGTGNATGTAVLVETTEDKTNTLYLVGVTADDVTALKRDTSIAMKAGTIAATLSGNASTATKLKTARTIQTNLESAASASFDGSANIAPGITGTLPVANGGTGATTAAEALTNLGAAASNHTHDDRYYTESETDTKLAAKAPVASPVHTGKIELKDSSADVSASELTTTRNNYIGVKDKNDRYLAWINGAESKTGAVTLTLSARRYNDSANVDNGLALKVSPDGTRAVAVSDKTIWRNAIGASSGIWPTAVGGTGNANGTVAKLTTARSVKTNLESADSASFDGSADITPGVSGVLSIANGGTGNTTGLAASATKLANARTVRTNLASTSTASFNGTANIAPGVTGILPITHGGTGNENGLAASAAKLETARSITANLESTAAASFDGSADVTPGVSGVLPIANGGTGASTVASARKVLFNTNLESNGEFLMACTGGWVSGGYIKLPLSRAMGGTGGTDSGWQALTNTEVFTGTIYYRKIGPFVTITAATVKLVTALSAAKSNVVFGNAVLPSGYRPKVNIYAFVQTTASTSCFVVVSSGGSITFYNCANATWGTGTAIVFHTSYIAA